MRAVLINGSPRRNGNTALLLKTVAESLKTAEWDAEIVQLGGRHVQGCRGCGHCAETRDKRCIFGNDDFNEIFAKTIDAQALILGTPCYFTDVTAEMKAFLDRAGFVSLMNGGLYTGKIGAAVVAVRRGGATHAFDSINHMFLMSKMLVPGSTYWNMGYGLGPGEVETDEEGLANMRQLGHVIAWLGQAIAPHLDKYPDAIEAKV